MKPRLLIVDDDEDIRSQMKWALAADYEISLAEDRPTAVAQAASQNPMVALLDLGLPPHPGDPSEGLATLGELTGTNQKMKVIIVSGQSEKKTALEAIGNGAYDFLPKPVDMQEMKLILKRVFNVAQLEEEYGRLQQQRESEQFEDMIGSSPQMQEVFSAIRKVATTNAPVLILGESGTGKERAALAIHHRSMRKDGPFIAINCGAIPETLLESELFGHEKGAFTGAHMQRPGRIESASGGTLFLDEIGELPQELQVKLLRFLQEQTIERVGGRREIAVDTRVIAATNTDLAKAMSGGTFREDLYYRLAVVVLKLPALRDRPGDLAVLGQAFLHRFSGEVAKTVTKFKPEALRAMQQYHWPGNIRELENRIRRAVIMAEGTQISAADLELAGAMQPLAGRTLQEAREALEKQLVQAALLRHGGKISHAATDLGISRPTLYELMEKLGLRKEKE